MIEFVGATPNRWPGALNDLRYRVDHTTEGGYAGSLAWLLNPASQVSAHLLVREDGHIAQLCDLRDAAWHAGIVYAPRTPLYDGTNPNLVAVGVEYVGTFAQPLTPAQIATAKPIDDLIRRTFGRTGAIPHVPHSDLATGGPNMRRDPGTANFAAIMAALAEVSDLFEQADRQKITDIYDKVVALAQNIPFVWLERLARGEDPATGLPLALKTKHIEALKKIAKEVQMSSEKDTTLPAGDAGQKGEWPSGVGPEPVAPERATKPATPRKGTTAKKMVRKTTRVGKGR